MAKTYTKVRDGDVVVFSSEYQYGIGVLENVKDGLFPDSEQGVTIRKVQAFSKFDGADMGEIGSIMTGSSAVLEVIDHV